jgi:hypothetical protein
VTTENIFNSGTVEDLRSERAQRAIRAFRAMQPGLSGYARAITGKKNVQVILDGGTPRTDGTKIYFKPPIELGDLTPHSRGLCERRDQTTKQQLCPACKVREEVLIAIYHEIAHIVFGTFAKPSNDTVRKALERALQEIPSKYAEGVKKMWDSMPEFKKKQQDHLNLSGLISPFLPVLVNAIEDARVDEGMFKARRGTKVMFDAYAQSIFVNGVEDHDGKIWAWNEKPLNSQITIGVFVLACGYKYQGWFSPEIETALEDAKLRELVARIDTLRSAEASYNLAFPILARLRELGFCRTEEDPEDEEEQDESQDEGQDEDEAGEPEDGSDGDEAGNESDGDESSDQGEGSSDEEASNDGPGSPGEDPSADGSADGTDSGDVDGDVSEDHEVGDQAPQGGTEQGSDSSQEQADEEASDSSGGGEDDDSSPADEGSEDDSGAGPGEDSEADRGGDDSNDSSESDDRGDAGSDEGDGSQDTGESSEGRGPGSEEDGGSSDSGRGSEGNSEVERGSGQDLQDADEGVPGDGDSEVEAGDNRDSEGELTDGEADGPDGEDEGNQGDDTSSPADDSFGDGNLSGGDADLEGLEQDLGPSDDEELIDTGADEGEGGTTTESPDYGSAEQALEDVQVFGKHEAVHIEPTPAQIEDDKAITKAIIQGEYFEKPSVNIGGVREHKFGEPYLLKGQDISTGWQDVMGSGGYSARMAHRLGINVDLSVGEDILGPALLEMRRTFSDNARARMEPHLRRGKVNQRVLGKRAWTGTDDRLFQRKIMPGRRSYAVLIGIDISGSTVGVNIALAKRAAMTQAELCYRAGLDFAVYAHTANSWGHGWEDSELWLDMYEIKAFESPWNDKAKEALNKISSDAENLDGHGVEYYRKLIERHPATDKVILYYSDGKMPAANYDEELEILQREIAYCKAHKITLLGVGIRTDSPARHGLDTVQVDDDTSIAKVVKHLEKALLHRM